MKNFTDRYIKVPVILYDTKEENILGKEDYDCEQIETMARINPFEIEYYRSGIHNKDDFEEKNMTVTSVFFKSGESLLVFMHIDEFENLLNSHQ